MWILRAQSVLAIGAAGAVVCALASGQVACSSSSSAGSSSGSSSGGTEEGGVDSGSSSGSSSGGSSGGSSGSSSGSTGEGGTEPTISISSPMNASTVTPTGSMDTVDITFSLMNFMVVAPGTSTCSNTSDNCGHIHVLVDDAACTPDGAPYDNADGTSQTMAQAILSTCPMVAGMHKITLELHHNDHSPVQVGGMTVQDSVMVTASAGGGDAGSD